MANQNMFHRPTKPASAPIGQATVDDAAPPAKRIPLMPDFSLADAKKVSR